MPEYAITLEPWSAQWWAEARALGEEHFEEVDGGVEPRRKFELDEDLMAKMDEIGCLKLVTARRDKRMVGYYTWNLMPDVESRGLLIGMQGAWFVRPGNPRLAAQMWDFAVDALRRMGVQCIFPHHRTQGRGKGIGRFFQKRGAKLIQYSYVLWIGA